MKGEVLFIAAPGYGFILAEDGNQIFFHLRDRKTPQTIIRKGAIVCFTVGPNPKRPGELKALQIEPVTPVTSQVEVRLADSN